MKKQLKIIKFKPKYLKIKPKNNQNITYIINNSTLKKNKIFSKLKINLNLLKNNFKNI